MCFNLFVYGTLKDESILKDLIGRIPKKIKARLYGYKKYNVKGEEYPGIKKEKGGIVSGFLLLNLTQKEFEILDDYEEDEYIRIIENIKVKEGKYYKAFVYVIKDENLLENSLSNTTEN